MRAEEVVRPAQVLQFADGSTARNGWSVSSEIVPRRHRNGMLNGVFVDGHAGAIRDRQFARVERDDRGYYKAISAADR